MIQMYMMKISMRTPKDDLIEKQKDCSDYYICNSYVNRYLHKLIYKRKTAEKAQISANQSALSPMVVETML